MPEAYKPISESSTICRIAFFIPAYNEEASIRGTVLSALKQTACNSPDIQVDILVIADNCKDRTVDIVLEIIEDLSREQERPNVFLMTTKDNQDRKAGALNQAYRHIRDLGYTFIASADADTIWDANFLKNGLRQMAEQGETLGGICGRVCLLPFEKKPFRGPLLSGKSNWLAFFLWPIEFCLSRILWLLNRLWEAIWWSFQNVEYSVSQSETIERLGKAHCLVGPGTIFRATVLEQLYRKYGHVWAKTLVEDFDLTVRIQMAGYQTQVGHDMFVYTDCPIGFHAHGVQRERWNGGNIATYLTIGLNRHTLFGGTEMGWQLIWFACRISLFLTAMQIIQTGFAYIDLWGSVLLLAPLVGASLLNVLRFKYVAYKSWLQFILLVLFGYEIYALWYGLILTKSFYRAFTNSVSKWR